MNSKDTKTLGSPADSPHRLKIELRDSASREIIRRANPYETQFGITFIAFAHFPLEYIKQLHSEHAEQTTDANFTVSVLDSNPSTLRTLTRIANESSVTDERRKKYLDAFLNVYRNMHLGAPKSTITVAPRREGMLLARELGWLAEPSFLPHMKRIPFNNGLVVGIEHLPPEMHAVDSCRIIDGAIASGATVITLMELFCNMVDRFEIYTVHCPEVAIDAILYYAAALRKNVSIHAGYVSGLLNKKFYAVSSKTSKLIVGDVGDMIAPILDHRSP